MFQEFPTLYIVGFTACTFLSLTSMANFSCSTMQRQTIQLQRFNVSHLHGTFERFQHPDSAKLWIVQFSCSLYLYFFFFGLFRGGGSGGVALMYIIPSIRFELDFYRILCRVFCFGEILPVVRDFCSLSLVSGFVPGRQLMASRGKEWLLLAYSFGCSD